MTSTNRFALAGLMTVALIGFAAPTSAQELCINAPARSLTDSTTESEEARQRIDALGNRCVRSQATGERVTRSDVVQFLQSDPDNRDIDYSNLVEPE